MFVGKTAIQKGAASADAQLDSECALGNKAQEVLIGHICSQSLSPWTSWFQAASTDSEFDHETNMYRTPLRIRVNGEFFDKHMWAHRLDLDLQWSVLLYRVVWRNVLLGEFRPNVLELEMFKKTGNPTVIWGPFAPRLQRKGAAKVAWGATLAEVSGSDADGDNDAAADTDAERDAGDVARDDALSDEADDPQENGDDLPQAAAAGEGADEESSSSDDSSTSTDASMAELEAAVNAAVGVGDVGREGSESSGGSSSDSSSTSSSSSSRSDASASATQRRLGDEPVLAAPMGQPSEREAHRVTHDKYPIDDWTSLTYSEQPPGRRDFIVRCSRLGHNRCVFTRTANGSDRRGREGQGRCLGLVVAWALAGGNADLQSKAQHNCHRPSKEARAAARAWFSGMLGAVFFVAKERPLRAGENEGDPFEVP